MINNYSEEEMAQLTKRLLIRAALFAGFKIAVLVGLRQIAKRLRNAE
jgi:hypothetical protein